MMRMLLMLLAGISLALSLMLPASPLRLFENQTGESASPQLIKSEWGKRLNRGGIIPNSGFKAIYFVSGNMDAPVFQENVDSIAIKYAWDAFHNIQSENFAAYWVGKVSFSAPTKKRISVSQSWARARILIDGEVVFDAASKSEGFVHDFDAGEHVVEVEFENNWHTVEFKVTIDDVVEKLSVEEISDVLEQGVEKPADLYLVSLYESGAKDTSVTVNLPRTGRPRVLWLTSYEAIEWKISSPDPVEAVVVSAYAPGSRVRGDVTGRVLELKGWRSMSSELPRCSCTAGWSHCESGDDDVVGVADRLRDVTGLALSGYAVEYSAKAVSMKRFDDDVSARLRQRRQEILDAAKQCGGASDFAPSVTK